METQTATTKKREQKDTHLTITRWIIEKLREGIVPWQVSWTKAGLPVNLVTGNVYRSVNRIILASLGYSRNLFLTSKQLKGLDGAILAEERPHLISFYGEGKTETTNVEADNDKKELLPYTVFNIAQCKWDTGKTFPEATVELDQLQDIVSIKSKDQKLTYYDPCFDFINLPHEKNFPNKQAYCEAQFHQLMHSTGHHTRLNRKDLIQMSEFGYDSFSHEELVAEIGTAYLMSHFGYAKEVAPTKEYLDGWIQKLEQDKYLIFSAALQAEKAISFLFLGETGT